MKRYRTEPPSQIYPTPNLMIFFLLIKFIIKQTGYSDNTVVFTLTLIQVNKYIIISYNPNSNAILADPINNIQSETIRDGFVKLHTTLKTGYKHQIYT